MRRMRRRQWCVPRRLRVQRGLGRGRRVGLEDR